MKNENLNPQNLPDIAEALKRDNAGKLWFFLDDSIPTAGKNDILQLMDTGEWQSQICLGTDFCFFAENDRELINGGYGYMKPYIPFLRSCYRPYIYTVDIMAETPEQKKRYEVLEKSRICASSLVKQNEDDVPARITLSFCGTTKTADVFLSDNF